MCPTCETIQDKLVLCIGKICLDIIQVVDQYPEEDSDKRSIEHWWNRGGNASNMCTVLSVLGQKSECLGSVADHHGLSFIEESFRSDGVIYDHMVRHGGYPQPMSTVLLNLKRGTRTIIHGTKGLPEITHEDFSKIDMRRNTYKWIHLEGRPCVPDMKKIIESIEEYNSTVRCPMLQIKTSLEIEKYREGIEVLIPLVDVVFISKDYATHNGLTSKEATLERYITKCRKGAVLIVPWGEDGAIAATTDGQAHTSGIYPPDEVRDTLGAGDTFIAATVYSLSRGGDLLDAIRFGCQIAGAKCGIMGFHGLHSKIHKFVNGQS